MDEMYKTRAPEVSFDFSPAEDGVWKETNFSIARRINDLFGFDMSEVSVMEGDGLEVAMLGRGYRVFTAVTFVVRGLGWWTDFRELARAPEFDEGE